MIPLTKHKTLSPQQLEQQRWIAHSKGSLLRQQTETALVAMGLDRFNIGCESSETYLLSASHFLLKPKSSIRGIQNAGCLRILIGPTESRKKLHKMSNFRVGVYHPNPVQF